MNYIGDFFAIGLIIILGMFYFDRDHMWTKSSKYFVTALGCTALNAVLDIFTNMLLETSNDPLWLNIFSNSAYFLTNIITTSFIALFLFDKILEHIYDDHCMIMAKRGLKVIFSFYTIMVLSNLWTGWMFYFDAEGTYYRGILNPLGYFMVFAQMILVLICYFRNWRNASFIMRRVLIQTFPVIVLCVIIQRIYPNIMLNSLIISFMDTVLFLTFQGQRQGVHNLTRLNDRHRFFKDMESRILQKERFQIFLINIKDFGIVNEKYGHLFGDEALYQFAYALERLVKNSMAFHMNGTVFALAIPYTTQMNADENCSKVLGFLEEGIDCRHAHINFEHVIVEYLVDEQENDAAELYEKLEYAATLAYEQKHKYIRYTADIGRQMHRTRYLIDRLQTIDREHGFSVWYQPIKCLQNQKFCSMEALVRLHEPDDTMISPGEFIPVAEQTGLINSVTWFVLEEVCRFISSNDEVKDIAVSINLPMTQLLDKGFATRLNSITSHYHVDHRQICLEFTERAILENFEKTKGIMENLVADGYRFYLDDFGTGYSNFNCLLQLPFQFIKLDRSLTRTDRNGNQYHDLVHTLTTLFHGMKLEVIAEGTETKEDVEAMVSRGVDRIQGFYFARPMDEQKILDFYQNHPL